MNDALRLPLGMGPGVTHHPKVSTTGRPVGAPEQLSIEKAEEMAQFRPGSQVSLHR